MKQFFKIWNFKKHLIVTAAIFIAINSLSALIMFFRSSIGIIGSSGGPTAIYTSTTSIGSLTYFTEFTLILLLFSFLSFVPVKLFLNKNR